MVNGKIIVGNVNVFVIEYNGWVYVKYLTTKLKNYYKLYKVFHIYLVIKRFNMEKLTKEQEERVEKFWDKAKLNDLVTSNAPPYLVEHHLFSTLSLEDETEFLVKSKELGVLKNVL